MHLPSCHHANSSCYKRGISPSFPVFPPMRGRCIATLGRAPFLITIGSFPLFSCEKKAWDESLSLSKYDFCFFTVLTDAFVWCSGWDPMAFTWQPGNQSFRVAMVTRGGKGGEVHFITVGCVPSWKPTEFSERDHYEHNNQKKKGYWHQDNCVPVSETRCSQGCEERVANSSMRRRALPSPPRDQGAYLLSQQASSGESVSTSSTLN